MLCVSVLLAIGPEAPAVVERERVEIGELRVAAGELEAEALQAEIRMRMPEAEVRTYRGSEGPLVEGTAFVGVDHPPSDPRWQITIITADGAGWVRVVDAEGVAVERAVAIEVANLVEAIAGKAVAPNVEGARIPEDAEAEREDEAEREPAIEAAPRPEAPVESVTEADAVPRLELDLLARGEFGIGFAGPRVAEPFAAGGGLEGIVRWRNGALVDLDLRGSGWRAAGLGVGRVRIGIGGGYGFRSGAFDLVTALLFTVEPWFPSDALRRSDGERVSPPPLLGLALRVSPAWISKPLGRRGARMRIGGRLELAGSGNFDDGFGVPRIAPSFAPNDFALRVGGLELGLAAELGLAIPLLPD